jgi:hypothetical protein
LKKSNYILVYVLLSISLLTLVGCRSTNMIETSGNTTTPTPIVVTAIQKIDWVDFLKLNGVSYTGLRQGVLTDGSKLGQEIGSITFHVADIVHDPHYVINDGDAAFLPIGTVVRAIDGYPEHEIVAVEDAGTIGGYKLYVADDKKRNLQLTFEKAVQHEIIKVAIYSTKGNRKPIVELKDGSQMFLINLLQRAAQEKKPDLKLGENPQYYSFVIDSGTAIGYSDTIYKDGNNYYWNHPDLKQLQNAFAYYLANERDVVFTIQGMTFPLPNHADTVATGERIKRNGAIDNITLIGVDGVTERILFAQETIDQLRKKAREINPSDGEDKASLFIAASAMPVNGGQLIAYATNKDTIVKRKNGAFNVNLIHLDGTGDRMIVDGTKYGGSITLLDSVGDRLVAAGQDHSLLDINIATGAVRRFPINGMSNALSVDGRYVLYQKMAGDSLVGTELAAFDLEKGTSIELGTMPKNYVFAQGIK